MSFKIIPLTRAVPALLGEAAAKTITLAQPATSTAMEGEIDGTNANAWIYAVDDGGDDVVVSWVANASEYGAICLARLDPSAGVDAITGKWTVTGEVVVYEGDENKMVKDTCHVFAQGFHWISFSTGGNADLYLLVLDRAFTTVSGPHHVFGPWGGSAQVWLNRFATYATNDHFMVARASGGVEIGIKYLDGSRRQGHYIVRVNSAGDVGHELEFVNSTWNHGNLASATSGPPRSTSGSLTRTTTCRWARSSNSRTTT